MSALTWDGPIPYFGVHELACQGTGIVLLDIRFAVALPVLRERWGLSLSPSSVCRTPAHNEAVKGHPTSMHLTVNPERGTNGCMAADLRWRGWPVEKQQRFARLAYSLGWSVGLHNGFCHVDRRADVGLRQGVFLYGSWDGRFAPAEVVV